jgi:hypothetical protein
MTSPENTPRTNLVPNPSFKASATGWAGTGGATVARVTADYAIGSASLEVTKAAAANSGAALSSRVAAVAGLSYAVSAYVKVAASEEASTIRVKVDWYTALTGGSLVSSSLSEPVELEPGLYWSRIGKVATAPASTAAARVSIIQPAAGTAAKKFLVDGVLLEQASQVNLYTDDFSQGYETTVANKALTPLPPPVFTGMKLKADVQLGGMVFNTIDENGVVWVITDIGGWWGHPEPEMKDIDRGWGDGSYDVRGRWAARDLKLEGVFIPPDPSYVPAARDALIEATSLVYRNAWLYVNEVPTKAAKVRLSGRPDIETVNPRGRTEFSVGLRAPDPIKYGWNWERADGYYTLDISCANAATGEDGTETVDVDGNTDVHVILEVTGPLTGPASIYNSGSDQELTIIGSLRAATSRTVTNKARTAAGLVTLTTSAAHGFLPNDTVTVAISDATFDGTFVIADTPTASTFTYEKPGATVAATGASGSASIPVDVLEIDTYALEVAFNGSTEATRSMLDTLTDWLVLSPGSNEISFADDGNANSSASLVVYYRPGWIG